MIIANILLGVAAGILFLFLVGESKPPMSKERHQNITIAFTAVLALIAVLNIIA